MYLSELNISGYRIFKDEITIELNKGINVIVGENGCGKSTIIDAIRLLLFEDEYSRYGISEGDFNRNLITGEQSDEISINGRFTNLTEEQEAIYLTWLNNNFDAELNLIIQNKYDGRNNFKKKVWGGISSNSIFDWEVMNDIQCVYLPPLRDAERKLRSNRGSRLARLLINLSKKELLESRKEGRLLDIEKRFEDFNREIEMDNGIKYANNLINENLERSLGSVFGQSTKIQFSETSFEKIVESLKVLFFPKIIGDEDVKFRNLSENSLGYNNLVYLATILAEFEGLKSEYQVPRILLIEEPEAHLHPQLQIKLLKYLESQAKDNDIQIIISTHSPTITASVSLDTIKVMCITSKDEVKYISLDKCKMELKAKRFLNRWLDVTKSTLLFSKGVILVEGLAESLLIPKFASIILSELKIKYPNIPSSLEDAGISIINMNGIYFEYFMQLYKGYQLIMPEGNKADHDEFKKIENFTQDEYIDTQRISIRCVGITDNDPNKNDKPTFSNHKTGNNHCLYLTSQLENMTDNCRLFFNLKTFEYDMALYQENLVVMIELFLELLSTNGPIRETFVKYKDILEEGPKAEDYIANIAFELLEKIESTKIGKGLFAQELYEKIENEKIDFKIPTYIVDAVKWVLDIEKGDDIATSSEK